MRSKPRSFLFAFSTSVTVMMFGACGCPAPPSATEPPGAAAATARPGVFSRAELTEDARQLANILEASHPDP